MHKKQTIVVNLPELLFKKQLPRSIEAEMSLLGSLILDHTLVDEVAEELTRGPDDFYNERHGAIYSAIAEVADRNNSLDLVQLIEQLRASGILAKDGEQAAVDADEIVKLAEAVPSPANAVHYAKIVAHHARTRRLIEAGSKMVYAGYHLGSTDPESAFKAIDEAQADLFTLAERPGSAENRTMAELMQLEIDLQEADARPKGLPTGLRDLDDKMYGLHRGELTLIAARPSMGKTALMLSLVRNIAGGTTGMGTLENTGGGGGGGGGVGPVAVFSLEMRQQELTRRLVCGECGLELGMFRRGDKVPADRYRDFLGACSRMSKWPVFIDDASSLTITQLRTRARRMVAQHGVQAIFVDYIQLMTEPGAARENRQVEVSAISRGLKGLARELDLPVVALSQLNRDATHRADFRPRMSDLRESGSLEQDADNVLLLHREDYYHKDDPEWLQKFPGKLNVAEIIIAKQRQGAMCTVEVDFEPKAVRFVNMSHWQKREVPAGW